MKKVLIAVMVGMALAGAALAQTPPAARVKIAVVEFTPGPQAAGMTHEAKRHLQASLAFALVQSRSFDVVDVKWTREASADDLAAINGSASTAAAVKLGKRLGVSYVLTGAVVEYTPQGADGSGHLIWQTRFIEVATGKVKHADETTQLSTSAMRTNGVAEMHTKTLKPAIEKLTATLAGLRY